MRSVMSQPTFFHSSSSLSPSPRALLLDQRLVGAHTRHRVHVVALGLADQRIEDRSGEMAGPRQPLQAGHQGVFVSPMQRVARLERHHALPALGLEQPPASGAATG